jgi:phosphoribosylglycinamide formyltransferase-1
MSSKLKLGVLISGKGSNLQSLIDATKDESFPAEIVIVIANVPEATGLGRANKANIPCVVINHKSFKGRKTFEDELNITLLKAKADLVCLAGFMRLLTDNFLSRWRDKVVNIHPSLLPSFKGLNTHERAIKAGVKFSGCTIHFVRSEMDDGPIIMQSAVPIHQDDNAETLANRILKEEHKIYPLAVSLIASKKIIIKNELVKIKDAIISVKPIINPS